MISPYTLKTLWYINIIPGNNESVWLAAWHHGYKDKKTIILFFCPFIFIWFFFLVYIISILLLTHDKVHRFRIFYIYRINIKVWCKKFAFQRRWHLPGVYVSPCSLAPVLTLDPRDILTYIGLFLWVLRFLPKKYTKISCGFISADFTCSLFLKYIKTNNWDDVFYFYREQNYVLQIASSNRFYIYCIFKFPAHIFFDDCMELNDDEEWVPNQFVRLMMSIIDEAAR